MATRFYKCPHCGNVIQKVVDRRVPVVCCGQNMEKELVLKTMRETGKPIAAGEVATLSGLDRKVVDKVFAELKKTGEIVSPVRCKWTPAE